MACLYKELLSNIYLSNKHPLYIHKLLKFNHIPDSR